MATTGYVYAMQQVVVHWRWALVGRLVGSKKTGNRKKVGWLQSKDVVDLRVEFINPLHDLYVLLHYCFLVGLAFFIR